MKQESSNSVNLVIRMKEISPLHFMLKYREKIRGAGFILLVFSFSSSSLVQVFLARQKGTEESFFVSKRYVRKIYKLKWKANLFCLCFFNSWKSKSFYLPLRIFFGSCNTSDATIFKKCCLSIELLEKTFRFPSILIAFYSYMHMYLEIISSETG